LKVGSGISNASSTHKFTSDRNWFPELIFTTLRILSTYKYLNT